MNFHTAVEVPSSTITSLRCNSLSKRSVDQLLGRNYYNFPQIHRTRSSVRKELHLDQVPPPQEFKFATLNNVESSTTTSPNPSVKSNRLSKPPLPPPPVPDFPSESLLVTTDADFFSSPPVSAASNTGLSFDFNRSEKTQSVKSSTSLMEDLFGGPSSFTPTSSHTPSTHTPSFAPMDAWPSSSVPATNTTASGLDTGKAATSFLASASSASVDFDFPGASVFPASSSTNLPFNTLPTATAAMKLTFQESVLSSEKAGQNIRYELNGKILYQVEDEKHLIQYPVKLQFQGNDLKHYIKEFQSNDFTFISNRITAENYKIAFDVESAPPSPEPVMIATYKVQDQYKPALIKAKQRLQFTPSPVPSLQLIIQVALNPQFPIKINNFKLQVSLANLFNRIHFQSVRLGKAEPSDSVTSNSYDEKKHILTFLLNEVTPSSQKMFITLTADVIGSNNDELIAQNSEFTSLSLPILVKGGYENYLLSNLTIASPETDKKDILPIDKIEVKKSTQIEFRFQ